MTSFSKIAAAAIFGLGSACAAFASNKDDCLQDQDPALAARACPLYQAELAASRGETAAPAETAATPKPQAQVLPAQNWLLNPEASKISITSTKEQTTTETHFFRTIDGSIDASGRAVVTIDLSSLDTSIDIRNVRMRFLFFETFEYPTATLTAQLDPADFADMSVGDTISKQVPVTVDMHGVTRELTVDLIAIRIAGNLVKVVSTQPVRVPAADFNLDEGVSNLSDAAGGITIDPVGTIAFDLSFEGGDFSPELLAARETVASTQAEETSRELTTEECQNRMDVISQTRAIYFASGSARINQAESAPVLDEVAQFFNRCPAVSMLIAGHTDSDGGATYNQDLSERRAAAVAQALMERNVNADRMSTAGFGEAAPVDVNTTSAGKAKNRRIAFRRSDG
jgi:outer membrane protein OmpA-like peptidoglycan-associated protein/polyisoprenoid-binding protein YceI